MIDTLEDQPGKKGEEEGEKILEIGIGRDRRGEEITREQGAGVLSARGIEIGRGLERGIGMFIGDEVRWFVGKAGGGEEQFLNMHLCFGESV
jgi:hypothetical protein